MKPLRFVNDFELNRKTKEVSMPLRPMSSRFTWWICLRSEISTLHTIKIFHWFGVDLLLVEGVGGVWGVKFKKDVWGSNFRGYSESKILRGQNHFDRVFILKTNHVRLFALQVPIPRTLDTPDLIHFLQKQAVLFLSFNIQKFRNISRQRISLYISHFTYRSKKMKLESFSLQS